MLNSLSFTDPRICMGDLMREFPKPRVVISRCIEFESVRWNAQIIRSDFVKGLLPHVDPITVCPEVEIGLGVPRETLRLVGGDGELRLLQPKTGVDVTDRMMEFIDCFLDGLPEVDGFILKGRSPTSGLMGVKIYPKARDAAYTGRGPGLFGGEVARRYPGLALEEEGRLKNSRIREHFLRKLYTVAGFREARDAGGSNDLIEFHTLNKLMLKAYSEREMRAMGRLVANEEGRPVGELFEEYSGHLASALRRPPRCNAYVNVLTNSMGYFKDGLKRVEKEFFLGLLEGYREGRVPLVAPLDVLRSWVVRFDEGYLAAQSFLEPYPVELLDVDSIVEACGDRDYWKDLDDEMTTD